MRIKSQPEETIPCEPFDVAQWIGLTDATLLGTEPIELPSDTVERLKKHGPRVELSTEDVGAILGVSRYRVRNYCLNSNDFGAKRATLGYRRSMPGAPLKIAAAGLATWIVQMRQPPVPTTGATPRVDMAASLKAERELRERHNL